MSTDWSIKAEWMREVGAVTAEWNDRDQLVAATLGPAPAPHEDSQQKTQQPMTPDQEKAAAREAYRRTSLAASGRPVMLGGDRD